MTLIRWSCSPPATLPPASPSPAQWNEDDSKWSASLPAPASPHTFDDAFAKPWKCHCCKHWCHSQTTLKKNTLRGGFLQLGCNSPRSDHWARRAKPSYEPSHFSSEICRSTVSASDHALPPACTGGWGRSRNSPKIPRWGEINKKKHFISTHDCWYDWASSTHFHSDQPNGETY